MAIFMLIPFMLLDEISMLSLGMKMINEMANTVVGSTVYTTLRTLAGAYGSTAGP